MADLKKVSATETETEEIPEVKKADVQAEEPIFTKQQYLESTMYSGIEKDILSALLKDGKMYTKTEVKKILDDFKNAKAAE